MKKQKSTAKRELTGLNLQCRLLVDAIAASTPKDFERYREVMGRFTFLINESVYEAHNPERLEEIGKEQIRLKSRLDELRFSGLGAYNTFREQAGKQGLAVSIDHEGSILSAKEDLLHLPLSALSALETILRLYDQSEELQLWKQGAGCSVSLLKNRAHDKGDIENYARGAILIRLAQGFDLEGTEEPGNMSNLSMSMARIKESILSAAHETASSCALKVAKQTVSLISGLPLARYQEIIEQMQKAADFILPEHKNEIVKLVQDSLSIKNLNQDN